MYLYAVRDAEIQRVLFNLATLLSPVGMSAFLQGNIGPYLSRRAGDRFQSEGDDVSGPWAPLKPATIKIRQEKGFESGPINRRTGELENWVVRGGWNAYPSGFGASMEYPRNAPTGELREKVKTAQSGKAQPSTVPRPVLGVNEEDLLFLQASLIAAVETAVK